MATGQQLLILLLLLQVKHLIIDWCWQTPFELNNKGNYLHRGGILHAGKHAAGTLLCFMLFVTWYVAIIAAVLDGVVHYHIDWGKAKLTSKTQLNPVDSEFWWLMGLDQYLHQCCYLFLVWVFCL